ncbi:MAG: DNA repair ATPase [Bacteroidota bacterium]
MSKETKHTNPSHVELEGGTYEIIRRRLNTQATELRQRMTQLNDHRKVVFGAVETQLIANDRITTTNNCIPRDMVAVGNHFIFGYNVHIGLRKGIELSDVFSAYRFDPEDHSFHEEAPDLLDDPQFEEDFDNLYKYYKDTFFAKFAVLGPNLFMVFQVGKSITDIKTFKWAIQKEGLAYLGNRFDHEFRFPDQHEFSWKRTTRDMQRRGIHPHISIQDRVFVETIGGDLTIKVEDNTESGQGIYEEAVEYKDQTLDDAEFYYADLGNLIVLKIRPYQEKEFRYLIFNEKMQEVLRVDSLEEACVLLPDNQGLIFSNGYYLQTGAYKLFDKVMPDLHFEKRISSSNGEDFLYIFYNQEAGVYVLLPYNIVQQQVETPIVCSGFSIFSNGELCYFRAEQEAGRHHVIQVWQTPYGVLIPTPQEHADTWLSKVGNKDIVRGMAECNELLTLMGKEDSYGNLYIDLVKKAGDILDSYYWIANKEAMNLAEPLKEIKGAAASAIDEFEKVRRIRQNTGKAMEETTEKVEALLDKIRRYKAKNIDQFVQYLADLRTSRGEIIALKELRYVELLRVEELEKKVAEITEQQSQACVSFLLNPEALKPYEEKVSNSQTAIEGVKKVAEAKEVNEEIDAIGKELEMLIDIVSNLNIEDATQTTRIIDNISAIYAQLNTLRAHLKSKRKELQGTEATAEFNAQLKLLSQGVINYLDLCDTPAKCEEYLTKLMVQLEELEGKFTEYEEFVLQLSEKREEIYNAFESRKLSLLESRNKRANALMSAAERILKGMQNRVRQFKEVNDINAYFAADLMVNKVRNIVEELTEMEDAVKAGDVQSQLKTLKEDAIRQLRDRTELFVEGDNVIKFGRHAFSVNVQALDLTIVPKNGEMYYHLSGTNFFELVKDPDFLQTKSVWKQSVISENPEVYRAEYLAYRMLNEYTDWPEGPLTVESLTSLVQQFMATRYQEGYVKGVHDRDTALLLHALLELQDHIGLLRYSPKARACAGLLWHGFAEAESKKLLNSRMKGAGVILQLFPDTDEFQPLIKDISENILVFNGLTRLFDEEVAHEAAEYLFHELAQDDSFVISGEAAELYKAFTVYLKKKRFTTKFEKSIGELGDAPAERFELIRNWIRAFAAQYKPTGILEDATQISFEKAGFVEEVAALLFCDTFDIKRVLSVPLHRTIHGLNGEHKTIEKGSYYLDYHVFMHKLRKYEEEVVPVFHHYTELKKTLAERFREDLRLEEFRPRVLSSFVRNQLIDRLYLPIIGDNLAKQIGTVGENTRTDRQGLLLLISPPGYGKTTLMEYVANRLGLIFMKVNGPAIGHHITSLDPSEAPNAAAREEMEKLNLALEMGDNVMLYLDDIQHCNPEFLQKFISLCDAQRRIEGVYKGRTRTYDLRGKRVAVVMAGNPYTESGDKFRIPDMLSNRADTYNLGDILGDNDEVFRLSYLENALTSNPVLHRLSTRSQKDIYTLIQMAETGQREGQEFDSNFSQEELQEYLDVLRKMLKIRDVILAVNLNYISSAAQADEYRTEPPFLLQGSYRNMNRLAEKVMPIMNEKELETLIVSHYESEAQTLTSGAEANLLKFKQLNKFANRADKTRWKEICQMFLQQKSLNADRMAQLVQEMGIFSDGLIQIKEVLERGVNGGSNGKKARKPNTDIEQEDEWGRKE